jgi:transposase-like protein
VASWYLRYPLNYRDIEEPFLERGLAVDHSTLNRWVLAYALLIERRLRVFRCSANRDAARFASTGHTSISAASATI